MRYYEVTLSIPKPSFRWLQFRKRTLFLVLTLCCILLAIESIRAQKQGRSLGPIRELGGSVFYNCNTPIELRDYVGDDFMSQVVAIDFSFTEINDGCLQMIASNLQTFPSLQWVRFSKSQVTSNAALDLKRVLPGVTVYNTIMHTKTKKLRPQFIQTDRSTMPMMWNEVPI